eukprot:GHVU01008475.1.p1 GENE.GHVU01008475.1~~GHVU01008475.1.p1  ORF type:complete len:146 (+),score=18.01 GHVU01008475.1:451-888(+)
MTRTPPHSVRGGLSDNESSGGEDDTRRGAPPGRSPGYPVESPMKRGFTTKFNNMIALCTAGCSTEERQRSVMDKMLDDVVPIAKRRCTGSHEEKLLEMRQLTHMRQYTCLPEEYCDSLQENLLEEQVPVHVSASSGMCVYRYVCM